MQDGVCGEETIADESFGAKRKGFVNAYHGCLTSSPTNNGMRCIRYNESYD